MSLKAIVFDYDGTLVDTNACKHEAFFDLFPPSAAVRKVIEEVLAEMEPLSRHVIFPELLKRIQPVFPAAGPELAAEYIEQYRQQVVAGQQAAREMPGAHASLRLLSQRFPLYISTVTPQEDIEYLLKERSWNHYFKRVFGYPNDKVQVLQLVMRAEAADPGDIIMVGDGAGDRLAAEQTGCRFEQAGDGFNYDQFTQRLLEEYSPC